MTSISHWASRQKTQAPVDLCEQCGQRPKFIEPGGNQHQYCSRSCATKAHGRKLSACALNGCHATGKAAFSNFCSEEHGRQAVQSGQVQACDSCHEVPRARGNCCLACEHKLQSPGPRVKELPLGGTEFKDVSAQFLSEWDRPSAPGRPIVEKVYQVVVPHDIHARHDNYRAGQETAQDIRVYHSAQCICDLGTKTAVFCDFKSCGICCIVKSSFHEFAFGQKSNIGRFGEGIYSYKNPSLADVHATSATSTPYRVMIGCDATLSPDLEAPKDESLFLPIADAIVPAYIIMYTL